MPCIPFRFSECIRTLVGSGAVKIFHSLAYVLADATRAFIFKSSIKRLSLFSHEDQIPCQHHGGS